MRPPRIGIFDSGIGGLTVAREIKKLLPQEGLLYVADNARAPYGPRDPEEILTFSREITYFLQNRGAELIVVACNTATSAAIKQLRLKFPDLPFVGMEPAIKPAVAKSENGVIGVMATELTLKGERYQDLVRQYAPNAQLVTNPCKGLVPLIESGDWAGEAIQQKLQSILGPMQLAGMDTLVLGCTHYPFLRDQIETILGHQVRIIDPAPAAARQVMRLLAETTPAVTQGGQPLDDFFATGSNIALERTLGVLRWRWRRCQSFENPPLHFQQ